MVASGTDNNFQGLLEYIVAKENKNFVRKIF